MKGMDAVAFAQEWGRRDIVDILQSSQAKGDKSN
jgi:hypothetical protein